tara:strand:+ start:1621 stop:1968 length:348 start_codon:yes stop_codon:yes gene_type:complete
MENYVLEGKKHWLFHRLSAILLLPLIFWCIYSLSLVPEISYDNMILWVSNTTNFIFLCALIIVSAHHFQLGIQVIFEDYISNISKRNFLIKIVHIFYFILCMVGLFSLAIIYFGV